MSDPERLRRISAASAGGGLARKICSNRSNAGCSSRALSKYACLTLIGSTNGSNFLSEIPIKAADILMKSPNSAARAGVPIAPTAVAAAAPPTTVRRVNTVMSSSGFLYGLGAKRASLLSLLQDEREIRWGRGLAERGRVVVAPDAARGRGRCIPLAEGLERGVGEER